MAGRRVERLNEQLKREITAIVRDEVRDPRVDRPTVTAVETAPDLTYARAYISVVGDDESKQETLEGLRAAAPFIRGELGRRLHIRRTPELHFELDRGLERATRIERLLREARGGSDAPEEDAAGDEGARNER